MSKKKKVQHVATITAVEIFEMRKPLHDGWACGHGAHGDKKYNRRKVQRDFKRYGW